MHRCYAPKALLAVGQMLTLEGEEAHHALRVMRLRCGETCEVFDGEGQAARATVADGYGSTLTLHITELMPPLPPAAGITLALAIPKGGNMELIVQKAVELGVSHIIPLITERTIVRLDAKEARAKTQKWNRTVLEACKQCGVSKLPVVEEPLPYPQLLQRADVPALKLCCAITPTARPLREVLESARCGGVHNCILLIGPEGDFSPSEYAAAEAAGYTPITLGPLILRVETAVFMAVSAARYALDVIL